VRGVLCISVLNKTRVSLLLCTVSQWNLRCLSSDVELGSINGMSWNVLDLLTTVQKLSCVATPGNTGAVDLPGLLLVWHFFLSAWDLQYSLVFAITGVV